MLFLRSICHVICKGNECAWIAHLSKTADFMGSGCEMCTLSADLSLSVLSDISKLDCGSKV